eukprot:TRINITY_DN11929_c0_g1_i1.p1 TRINITY_DN11929_c0_g1~~TRINITY_DN11929_c0_g1_i1.p1  ORF type:complete len:277 (-),score=43.74 TRINITY_DN11929_c0_g1_i1:219-1049(-)
MDQLQYQQPAVYSQPVDVGVVGRVQYNDQMHAAFTVPANSGGQQRVPPIMSPTSGGATTPSAAQSPARGFRGTPDNAKTKMCMRWMAGECRFGDRCNFAHGDSELRQLPRRENPPVMQPFSRPPTLNGQVSDQYGRAGPFGRMGSYPGPAMVSQSPMMVQAGYGRLPNRAHSVDTATGTHFQAVTHNSGSNTSPYSPTNTLNQQNPTQPQSDMSRDAWMASGCPVPGQNGWWKYTSTEGEDYYHNYRTGATQWELPVDFTNPATPSHTAVSTPFQS